MKNVDSEQTKMSADDEMQIIKSIPILENELIWISRVVDQLHQVKDASVVEEKNKND
jgi:hypothetical protein